MKNRKQVIWGAGSALALIIILALIKGGQIGFGIYMSSQFSPPPEAVTSIKVVDEVWPVTLNAVGDLDASLGATLSAEIPGTVSAVRFESGSDVALGQTLIELDTGVEEASLRAQEARLEWARSKLQRAKNLRSSNTVSQDALDDAQSEFNQANAQADAIRASIRRKNIVAPFAGRAGIRLVNVGDHVEAGTKVVPLFALDPIYLNFSLPQRDVSSVQVGSKVEMVVDAFAGQIFNGKVKAVDPQVDLETRSLRIQASFPNSDGNLRPGMFAKLRLFFGIDKTVKSLPLSSINFAPYGDSIFVIESMKDPTGKQYIGARQQIVKLGERRGDRVEISEGLKVGEEVVTSGVFKLRPGAAVLVNNEVQPKNEIAPNPADT